MKKRMMTAALALAAIGSLFVPAAASARDRDDDRGGSYYSTAQAGRDRQAVRDSRARSGQEHNYAYQNSPLYNNGRYDGHQYGSYYGASNNGYSRNHEDRESWRDHDRQNERHRDTDRDWHRDRDWRR